jgi:hypothetical protein
MRSPRTTARMRGGGAVIELKRRNVYKVPDRLRCRGAVAKSRPTPIELCGCTFCFWTVWLWQQQDNGLFKNGSAPKFSEFSLEAFKQTSPAGATADMFTCVPRSLDESGITENAF